MGASASEHPSFRRAEKHFKNRTAATLPALRGLPADLCVCASVLDLSRPADSADDEVWRAGWWGAAYAPETKKGRDGRVSKLERKRRNKVVNGEATPERGERPASSGHDELRKVTMKDGRDAFVVADGCILIPSYLAPSDQETLLLSALAEYTRPPNPLSLDTHFALPHDLFAAYVADPNQLVAPKHTTLDDAGRTQQAEAAQATLGKRALIKSVPASEVGYDELKRRNATSATDPMSLKIGARSVEALMRDLRWANLGYVYQWSTKSYDFATDTPIPFPTDLADLCQRVVGDMPWGDVFSEDLPAWSTSDDYEPDTGIVNYYQLNDTLMAHVDNSELDPTRPLVSISLGHAALFLLGTSSRSDPPRPLILRSGDVLIMSGTGRQAYHGVPRVMEGTLPAHWDERPTDSPELKAAKRWVQKARININARQVFPPGFDPTPKAGTTAVNGVDSKTTLNGVKSKATPNGVDTKAASNGHSKTPSDGDSNVTPRSTSNGHYGLSDPATIANGANGTNPIKTGNGTEPAHPENATTRANGIAAVA